MAEAPKLPNIHKSPAKEEDVIERRSLRDYYIILRERLWIALPLALTIAVGIAYYQSRETPLYRSSATMQIEKPEKVVTTQEVVETGVSTDAELNTYLQVISSGKIRTRVLESLTPQERQILQRPALKDLPAGSAPPTGVDLGCLSVNSIRSTFLINVSVVHRDPEAAALLANRYVQQFIQSLLDKVGGSNEYAVEYLQKRATQLLEQAKEIGRAHV